MPMMVEANFIVAKEWLEGVWTSADSDGEEKCYVLGLRSALYNTT